MAKHKKHPAGMTGLTVDVPITLADKKMSLALHEHMLCAFAVLDSSYKEKTPSKEEVENQQSEKQKVCH